MTIREKYNAGIDALWEALTRKISGCITAADHTDSLEDRRLWNDRADMLLWCMDQVKAHLWPLQYPHVMKAVDKTESAERAGRN